MILFSDSDSYLECRSQFGMKVTHLYCRCMEYVPGVSTSSFTNQFSRWWIGTFTRQKLQNCPQVLCRWNLLHTFTK